jgi:hypothetical protein
MWFFTAPITSNFRAMVSYVYCDNTRTVCSHTEWRALHFERIIRWLYIAVTLSWRCCFVKCVRCDTNNTELQHKSLCQLPQIHNPLWRSKSWSVCTVSYLDAPGIKGFDILELPARVETLSNWQLKMLGECDIGNPHGLDVFRVVTVGRALYSYRLFRRMTLNTAVQSSNRLH